MGKFSTAYSTPRPRQPIQSTGVRVPTAEGGDGYERDLRSELFLTGVSNLVGEDTFYEDASTRDDRFRALVHAVTDLDPAWVAKFVPYLRNVAQLRSAPIVVAAEYVAAGGPNGRAVVNSAMARADEPGEFLAYWYGTYGRSLPAPVKRGVADAVDRLYTERSALRYDGTSKAWRFGDVIETVHPSMRGKDKLAKYLLSVRRHQDFLNASGDGPFTYAYSIAAGDLPILAADARLRALPEDARRGALGGEDWKLAGWSWERLSGWLPGGMDAQAWEAVIPQMGYMALLRNLRNFDQAGVSNTVASDLGVKLADPDEVAGSRQFPIRFYSAWREVADLRWAPALQSALESSVGNVPRLDGRTLVLIDGSGSMQMRLSGRSQRTNAEVAGLFGVAVAKRAEHADVFLYDDHTEAVDIHRPLLPVLDTLSYDGGATYLWRAVAERWNGHDRVIVITDEQSHDQPTPAMVGAIPHVYLYNLAGFSASTLPPVKGWHVFGGGLTDNAFKVLALLEAMQVADWDKVLAVS